jgi:hypothetical protein
MSCRPFLVAALAVSIAAGAACGPSIDLAKAVAITDVITGWYDWGIQDGQNKLVPSISFRLQNTGASPLSSVQMTVSFWQEGKDGENDSKQIIAVDSSLPPGASTNLLVVRSDFGATSPAPRAEMLTNGSFVDYNIKLFAKRAGKIVPVGQFKVDRRLLPHVTQAPVQR